MVNFFLMILVRLGLWENLKFKSITKVEFKSEFKSKITTISGSLSVFGTQIKETFCTKVLDLFKNVGK